MCIFLSKYVHLDKLCMFSYLNMFILINIYFVGHVHTLFGVGEEAYLHQELSQGGISIQRGTSIRGGTFIYF